MRFADFFLSLAGVTSAGLAVIAATLPLGEARAQDVQSALNKANTYIELAKGTQRAVDSWDRYASWVNMKTGPTGNERYISYGMYELHDVAGLVQEARALTSEQPRNADLDAAIMRYIDAYLALEPAMNEASAYYDREGYKTDNAAQGKQLHERMVPLAKAFLAERDAMMPGLRMFVRDVERQELDDIEKREGRSAAWHAGLVMHTASKVADAFPRTRPEPMSSEMLEEQIKALGPDTPAEKFDQLMSGMVQPTNAVIDVKLFNEALKQYADAVEAFDGFAKDKPEGLEDLIGLPRRMLDLLKALEQPLAQSKGHEFEGGGQMVAQIAELYFSMLNESSGIRGSQLRFLP